MESINPEEPVNTDELAAFIQTRRSLHALAEHVISPTLHAATGKIGLRATPGGFGTPSFEAAGGTRSVRVDGIHLVDSDARGDRSTSLSSLRHAAAFTGVEPGAPADVYTPTTALDFDADLVIDPAAVAVIADWYSLADRALEVLRAEHIDEQPAPVQLWPEHFDLATTISEVNYGASPGDEGQPAPYLYVGPWTPPARDGGFWNQPYGASLAADHVASVDDALSFFREGRERIRALA